MAYKIRKRKLKFSVKFIIALSIAIVLLAAINSYCTPIVAKGMESKATNIVNETINSAIYEELEKSNLGYNDLVHISRSQNNEILSIQTDTVKVNKLKSLICMNIQDKISKKESEAYKIPLGVLTDSVIFQGIGPNINFNIVYLSNISSNIKSEFVSVGMNQTKHLIYFELTTNVELMSKGYSKCTGISTNVYVAETVIVGKIPNVYSVSDEQGLNVSDLESLNEAETD